MLPSLHLDEINGGIHMYQFTFRPLTLLFFGCDCGFGFERKFRRIDRFGEKKAWIGGFAEPYSPPSFIFVRLACLRLPVSNGNVYAIFS